MEDKEKSYKKREKNANKVIKTIKQGNYFAKMFAEYLHIIIQLVMKSD